MPSLRVLIVEDYEGFRRFIRSTVQERVDFQFIGEASDGLEAVQKAVELQPDLILFDIGLPKLNGLEAARRIRKISPNSKILFLTQESSSDVVQEALSMGALGYVHKLCAKRDLLPAIDTVLGGKRFVSSSLEFSEGANAHRHEVVFCSGDGVLLDALAPFIATAINTGDAAIVLVNQSHRTSLFQRLKTLGVDVDTATQRGTFVQWDVREALSTFMVNDWPDAARLSTVLDAVIKTAAQGPVGEYRRVVTCGECAPTLWAEGKVEAAIHVEHLWNKTTRGYGVETLCVYPSLRSLEDDHSFKRLCAEHTAVHSA